MPKGQYARPFNKDFRSISESKLTGKTGLANLLSKAKEDKRKLGARLGGEPVHEKSKYDEKTGIWK